MELSAAEVEKSRKANGTQHRFPGSSMGGEQIPLASKLAIFEFFGHQVKKLIKSHEKKILLLTDLTERGGKSQEKWISAVNLCECLACLTSLTFQWNDWQEELANRWPVSQSLSSIFPLVCLCPCGICAYGYLVPVTLVLGVNRGEWTVLEKAISKGKAKIQVELYFLYGSFLIQHNRGVSEPKNNLHSPVVVG